MGPENAITFNLESFNMSCLLESGFITHSVPTHYHIYWKLDGNHKYMYF